MAPIVRLRCSSASTAISRTGSSRCDGATSADALDEVTNFINAHLSGLTLGEAQSRLLAEIRDRREALDHAAAELIASGLAAWSEDQRGARC